MLLVETEVKMSAIHGLGCFAREKIKKGQTVWKFDDRLDRKIPVSKLSELPESMQTFLRIYGYFENYDGEKMVVLCADNSRHMNHDENPNLAEGGQNCELNIAVRDIEIGEELTCNYTEFDMHASEKLSHG
jgi:uncharacterized protein